MRNFSHFDQHNKGFIWFCCILSTEDVGLRILSCDKTLDCLLTKFLQHFSSRFIFELQILRFLDEITLFIFRRFTLFWDIFLFLIQELETILFLTENFDSLDFLNFSDKVFIRWAFLSLWVNSCSLSDFSTVKGIEFTHDSIQKICFKLEF